MAKYNSGSAYNDEKNSFYNSAPRLVVIMESGSGADSIVLSCSLALSDSGTGAEILAELVAALAVADSGSADEVPMIGIVVLDDGSGNESMILTADLPVQDAGVGADVPGVAKTFFLIDSENVLHPLGVVVINGRDDLLPGTREHREEVPGRDGDISFGQDFVPRSLQLRVANSCEPATREQLKRTLAKWLNPAAGSQPLVYADEIEKTYYVKYADRIDLDQWPDYMEFLISLKATDPLVIGSFERTQVGSGTITNEGNYPTPMVVEVAGPITNPSIVLGSSTLSWTGTVPAGQVLKIDTGSLEVTLNGANALATYSGGFPKLQPGATVVTANSQVTISWRARWSGC